MLCRTARRTGRGTASCTAGFAVLCSATKSLLHSQRRSSVQVAGHSEQKLPHTEELAVLCKAKIERPTLCSRMTTSYKYKSGFGAVNRMRAVVGKTRGEVEGKPCLGRANLPVAFCEGRRGGQFAVPATAPRSYLRLVFRRRVNTGGAEVKAHFVARCNKAAKCARPA